MTTTSKVLLAALGTASLIFAWRELHHQRSELPGVSRVDADPLPTASTRYGSDADASRDARAARPSAPTPHLVRLPATLSPSTLSASAASRLGTLGVPHNLDDVPQSPTVNAALASVTKAWDGSPQGVSNLNYRLELLSDIADCARDQVAARGFVDVLIHLPAAKVGTDAVATSIQIKAARLPPAGRDIALRCVQQALVGSHNLVADAQFADLDRVAPMRIRFPIEDSAIYSFLETGDMRFYGSDYDGRP